jgi:hypothetical protein
MDATEKPQAGEADRPDEKAINDPLTRSDREAPRKEFDGRKPE